MKQISALLPFGSPHRHTDPVALGQVQPSEAPGTPVSPEPIPVYLPQLCYLFLIFLTGCFVGWVYEEIFYWITEGMLRNRGILYGPWLPIYGTGALGIYAMKSLKGHPVLLFVLCAVITAVVEYLIGFAGLVLFGIRLWDYRGLFWNLNGIICFRSVVSFAIMGMVFHYFLEPIGNALVKRAPPRRLRILCLLLLQIMAADCVLSALFRTPITY